jgi:hypothetical protein
VWQKTAGDRQLESFPSSHLPSERWLIGVRLVRPIRVACPATFSSEAWLRAAINRLSCFADELSIRVLVFFPKENLSVAA